MVCLSVDGLGLEAAFYSGFTHTLLKRFAIFDRLLSMMVALHIEGDSRR